MQAIRPYTKAVAVTLHDSNDQSAPAFFCGGAGNLKITTTDNDVVTLNGLLAGHVYEIAVKVFWSTGSTATNIVKLF